MTGSRNRGIHVAVDSALDCFMRARDDGKARIRQGSRSRIPHFTGTSHQRPRERSHDRRAQHRQSRYSRARGRTVPSSSVITAGAAALVRRGAAGRGRSRGRGLEDRASARAGRGEDGAVEREDLDVVHFKESIGVVGPGAIHVVDVLRKRNTEVSEALELTYPGRRDGDARRCSGQRSPRACHM